MPRTTWKAFIAFLGVLALVIAANNAVALVLWLGLKFAWWPLIAPSCLYTPNGLPAPPPQDYLINLIVFGPLTWLAWVFARRNTARVLNHPMSREAHETVLEATRTSPGSPAISEAKFRSTHESSPQAPSKEPLRSALGYGILIIGCIFFMWLLVQAPRDLKQMFENISERIDNTGWVSHDKVVSVRLSPLAWIPGEFKTCWSPRAPSQGALDFSSIPGHKTLGPEREITSLECDASGDYHDLKVRFWGPMNGLLTITWNCQRTESGEGTWLSCKVKD